MIAAGNRVFPVPCRDQWEHIRGDRIHLPDSKAGTKTIPLNGPALEVLAETACVDGSPCVIAGTGEGRI